jgi:hypothetical protein
MVEEYKHFVQDTSWQGLKPNSFSMFTARLKSCPDNKAKTQHPKGLLLLKYHSLVPEM